MGLTCSSLWAQNAIVSGTVLDASGASIPGAKVSIRNVATGVSTTGQTNGAGLFYLPPQPPGRYAMTAEAKGFATGSIEDLILEVGQPRSVVFRLNPGELKQSINVTEAAPLLNGQNADRGAVVENAFLKSIPLNVRNPMLLLTLTPGVTGGLNAGINTASQSTTNNFRINGGRGGTNEILIDGAANTGTYNNQVSAMPQVDAIQEFRVNTSPYAPEFGRTGGGLVSFAMRSGTNEFHGTAHNFLRNSALDANGFNANRARLPRGVFRRNQFGGTFGGPVRIPKLYDGRNRTFFFFAYEGLRERSLNSFTGSVPTALERLGNFSQSRLQNGQLIQIFDPRSTRLDPSAPAGVTRYIRDALPGNLLPSNLLSRLGTSLLQYYPQPNQPGDGQSNFNNFFTSAPNSLDGDRIDTKVDHQINNSNSVFFRYNKFQNLNAQPLVFGHAASPVQTPNRIPGINWAGNHTWTVTPSLIVEHFLAWNQSETNRVPLSLGFDQRSLGLPDSVVSPQRQAYFPVFSVGRLTGMGPQGTASNAVTSKTLQYQAKATRILGRHTMKFGYDFRRFVVSIDNPQPLSIGASGGFTGGPNPQAAAGASGHGLADLFLSVASVSYNIRPLEQHQHYYNAWFIQDEWRVTDKLNLTYGLRYQIELPRTEAQNQYVFLDLNSNSGLGAPGLGTLRGGLGFVGTRDIPNRRTQLAQGNMFEPRLGIAYKLNDRTVIRAGAGLFYHPLVPNTDQSQGFSRTTSALVAQPDGVTPMFNLNNPWPSGLLPPTGNSLGLNTLLGQGIGGPLRVQALPKQLQWSVDIQRQLPGGWVAEVGYAANNAYLLPSGVQYNQLTPETINQFGTQLLQTVDNPFFGIITDPTSTLSQARVQRGQLLRPFPQFTSMSGVQVGTGQSSYHAMQSRLEKRYSRGLAVLFAYTWSKTIDNTAELGGFLGTSPGYQNNYCFSCDRSLSFQDVPHVVRASFRYDLPKLVRNKFLGQVLNGWSTGSFFSFQSGTPLTVSSPNDSSSFGGGSGMRPMATGQKARLDSVEMRDGGFYFNPAAFRRTPQFQFGNVSRTLPDVRLPITWNWDALLEKRFFLTERVSLDFRNEFFNMTNSVNFAGPSTSVIAGDFGRVVLRQVNTPRQIQFALRLSF
jgi:hypothetical protein